MERLELEPTSHTPHIILDADKNYFLIEGKSFPEDSKTFYHPVIEWLKKYKSTNPKSFQFNCNLFYLSSSSSISVKQILLMLADYQAKGTKVEVVWNYDEDDDDIKKTGEDYMSISKLNFTFKVNADT